MMETQPPSPLERLMTIAGRAGTVCDTQAKNTENVSPAFRIWDDLPGCRTRGVNLPFFAGLEHVLDGGFVDQEVGLAGTVDLDAALVVPLDDACHGIAVLEHDDHGRLGLHLLL